MDKKTFFKGAAAGIVASVICINGLNMFHVVTRGENQQTPTVDQKIGTIANLLEKYYVGDLNYEDMEEGIYAGMVDSLGDPYTQYMGKEELQSFEESTDGAFFGIGVEVTVDRTDNSILVISPIDGTPAAVAGVLPQDKIIKVNDTEVYGDQLNTAVSLIKGPENTDVKITVFRPSSGEILDFQMKRSQITVSSVSHRMMEDNIGYLRISQFSKNTYEQFMEAYNDLNSQGIKGLVIDVRNNPGGLFPSVQQIADVLVPEGIMVYTIDKSGKRVDYKSDAKKIEAPLVLLVNGNSASASEILAGAVQDMGVGKLVGTQTFGKGLVQGLYTLTDGSGVKITIQKYYTPRGVCIQGEGIAPDYVVELPEEYQYMLNVPEEHDTQLAKAVEVIKEEMK